MDVALTLHADHELNASTFAARVAAATMTDIYSAVVAAIGTLKGPLHGGANAEVMKMLLELGKTASPERVDEPSAEALARKKIPGFGRVLPHGGPPPRTCGGCRASGRTFGRHRLVRHVAAHRSAGGARSSTRVDFYSASVYYALGIPISTRQSSPSAACRAGPRVLEQFANNRLIRPGRYGPGVSAALHCGSSSAWSAPRKPGLQLQATGSIRRGGPAGPPGHHPTCLRELSNLRPGNLRGKPPQFTSKP
jgi:citrate synthase